MSNAAIKGINVIAVTFFAELSPRQAGSNFSSIFIKRYFYFQVKLRLLRQETQNFNQEFWRDHNIKFKKESSFDNLFSKNVTYKICKLRF